MQPIRVANPDGSPRRNPELVFAARSAIPKQPPRKAAFKTSAAPDRYPADCRVLQCAVYPRSTRPVRRADIPVPMVFGGNKLKKLSKTPHQKGNEMMKKSRSPEGETT